MGKGFILRRNYFGEGLNSWACASLVIFATVSSSFSAERVRFATHFRGNPHYWLPTVAALDNGYWTNQGLEVRWIPFRAGTTMEIAVTAKEVDAGTAGLTHVVRAATRGVPQIMVADPGIATGFIFWVLTDSRLKTPADLKGTKVEVTRFGG